MSDYQSPKNWPQENIQNYLKFLINEVYKEKNSIHERG